MLLMWKAPDLALLVRRCHSNDAHAGGGQLRHSILTVKAVARSGHNAVIGCQLLLKHYQAGTAKGNITNGEIKLPHTTKRFAHTVANFVPV